jgi:fatty-acyl-CoA synthase
MAEATLAISFKPHGTLWHTDQVDEEVFRTEGRAVPATNGDLLEFVSCGRPFFGHELRILDPLGNPLPERTVGEIEVRGPSVTQGYYHNPAATEEVLVDQRLRTGDLGYLAEGELYVTGRKKDLIIINGHNYYPQTLEWLVEELPGVRKGNVVAFSRPGAKGTEELVIVCEVHTDEPEQLRDSITRRISEEVGLTVGDIVFLERGVLPKTTSGKLQRRKTLDIYAQGTLTQEGVRTPGQGEQTFQLAGHMLRAMVSRFRHSFRRMHQEPEELPLDPGKRNLPQT